MGLLSLSIHVISSNVVQFPQQTLPNNIDLDITAHVDKIREYILNNPLKWDLDRNNPNKKPRQIGGRAGKYYFEY